MDIGARFVENDAMVGSEGDGWVVVDRRSHIRVTYT
jgi:hypothetical protein